MKTLSTCLLLLTGITLCGQDAVSLFNGKDLTGWDGQPGWWQVEDGAITSEITLEKPCNKATYLIWRGGQPSDFELSLRFKISEQGNSGIQIRSLEKPNWDTFGYQADMEGDGKLVGFVYHHQHGLIGARGEKTTIGADGKKTIETIAEPAALLKHYKVAEWNHYRVTCKGPEISVFLNDILMCQITDHRVTNENSRGIIALQMHPGPPMKVQFKEILLKEFAPENRKAKGNERMK